MNEMQSFLRKKSSSTSRTRHLWSFLKKEKGEKQYQSLAVNGKVQYLMVSLRFYFYWCCLKVNHSSHCFFNLII